MSSSTDLDSQNAQDKDRKTDCNSLEKTSDHGIALRVNNVSKCFHIYDRPQDRLKQSILRRLRPLFGGTPSHYGHEFWALADVSFEVREGETIGVVGRNGSGKSTLLQIVCGTLMPTTGEVESRGRIAALLELGSGFNPEFTGRENVYVNGTVLGLSREQIDTRFAKIAAFADIGEFMEQPVKMYSSGMAVRLAFAVIANVDADILVIDEALAVGDAFFVQKCMRFLRQFMERGTVFFVSHDTAAIVNLCDRAIWLENGRIKAIGRPKEVTEAYLADAVESHQGASLTRINVSQKSPQDHENELLDQRSKYLNSSKYRNDIQLFHFDPASASYGRGGATIVNVQLQDSTGRTLVWCVGGEQVLLRIRCTAHQQLLGPIVGYYLKDRLGQLLFGDNTYLSRAASPLQVESGESFEGIFEFCMPILPVGNYSFCVAIAEGTQTNHVQHHWIHDALLITSHTSSVSTGLLGIPMTHIELRLVSKEESK